MFNPDQLILLSFGVIGGSKLGKICALKIQVQHSKAATFDLMGIDETRFSINLDAIKFLV